MRFLVIFVLLALGLAGCVSTDATPLSKNVYKLNADGRGMIGGRESATRKAIIKEAAELTLEKGFTHFVIADQRDDSSRTFIGMSPTTANTFGSATITGNQIYGQSRTNVYGGSPMYANQASSTAIVVMFESSDPRALNAVDAAEFLASL